MQTTLVTYANDGFVPYQKICQLSARQCGVDKIQSFSPDDIAPDFAATHCDVLRLSKGAGYWLWKPYFVNRVLANLAREDFLIYADAGTHFVRDVTCLIEFMELHKLDLLVMGEGFSDAAYTKRDAFVLMDADRLEYSESPQRFASVFVLRNNDWSQQFAADYLHFAQDVRILTDVENTCGLANYTGFVAHRHDQSIFSLLSKKYAVPFVRNDFVAEGIGKKENQVINHTRAQVPPQTVIAHLLAQRVLAMPDLDLLK
ncbi:MAG: hypothetical protein AAF420_13620 [Pseudomonadota bacterium]